jgi:hypothetical protein
MRPDPEDRLSQPSSRAGVNIRLLIAAIILVVIAIVYFSGGEEDVPAEAPAPAAVQAPLPAPEPELPPAPDIPPAPLPVAEPEPEAERAPAAEPAVPEAPPLTLEESDPVLREALAPAVDSDLLGGVLAQDNLVERGAGLIDAFSRGLVMRKLLPVAPPGKPFATVERGGQIVMDPAGYRRYDAYATAIAELDTALLADNFHRFRPLLEEAYAGLGYPAGDMDNALIRALDRVLATPEISDPIAVKKVEAVYKYVDPSLEQLPAVQKQLLRMGPDNIAKIKGQAAALRRALLQGAG